MEKFDIESQRKKFISMMIGFILILSATFSLRVTNNRYEVVLNASGNSHNLTAYKEYDLGRDGHFISGMEGRLYWRPNTLRDAIILTVIENSNSDFLDIVAMLIIACVVLYMFKGMKHGFVFTKTTVRGFMMLMVCIGFLGFLADFARSEMARHYIPIITHGQFRATYRPMSFIFNYMLIMLMLGLSWIFESALKLQDDSRLTI